MVSTYNRFKHKSIWLRYEDYANDAEGFRGLAEFLGEPFDQGRINAIISVPHSFTTQGERELASTSGDLRVHDEPTNSWCLARELLACCSG